MALSEPPARHTSKRPERTASSATPMASVPEAQAVQTVHAEPVIPSAMETFAQASFAISSGMASGETRRRPPSRYLLYVSSTTSIPPRPFPATIPVVSAAISSFDRFASATASFAAATRNCVKRAMRRASFGSMPCSSGLKSLTSAAIFTGQFVASNNVMGAMPHLPALMAFQSSGADLPIGVTAPMPVITTLLLFIIYSQDSFFFWCYFGK